MPRMSIRSIRHRRPTNPTWDVELERTMVITPEDVPGLWDWSHIFGRIASIEVEIGFGKGRFLRAAAERSPDRNWLGIEYAGPCVALAAERIAKRGLTNVRLVRGAAEEILTDHLSDASVEAFHVYFPDPWPKKRHHKRRLIKPAFAEEVVRALRPGGRLHIATDYGEYYDEMLPILTAAGLKLVDHPDAVQDEVFHTNYETRFLEQGKPIHRARFARPV